MRVEDVAVHVRVRRLRPQQDDDAVDRDVVLGVEQGVVHQHVGVLPGGGAGLEVDVDDFLRRAADADDQVGRGGDGGQIDVEQHDRPGRRAVEGRKVVGGVVAGEVLQRGVEGHRHGGNSIERRFPRGLTL